MNDIVVQDKLQQRYIFFEEIQSEYSANHKLWCACQKIMDDCDEKMDMIRRRKR